MAILFTVILLILAWLFFLKSPDKKSRPNNEEIRFSPGASHKKTVHTTNYPQITDTYIAGIPHRLGKNVDLKAMFSVGNEIKAVREKNNQYDANAVKLYFNQQFVGYIPQSENPPLAQAIDNGKILSIYVSNINASDVWKGVKIKISIQN